MGQRQHEKQNREMVNMGIYSGVRDEQTPPAPTKAKGRMIFAFLYHFENRNI
jgi:hypothetical protein